MKKFFMTIAVVCVFAGAASAQGLGSLFGGKGGDILNTVTNVVSNVAGVEIPVSLPGTWTYTGSAIALGGGESVLSNVAGSAANTMIEGKINEYLKKIGIAEGTFTYVFNQDGTFTCTVKKLPLNGTWTMDASNNIQLKFGKTMQFFTMEGVVKMNATGCEMLFDGHKFLDFAKKVMTLANKKQASSASSSLLDGYKDLKIGMNLTRVK